MADKTDGTPDVDAIAGDLALRQGLVELEAEFANRPQEPGDPERGELYLNWLCGERARA